MKYLLMTRTERHELWSALETMPAFLLAQFGSLSASQTTRPGPDGTFSPVEQCWHLADLEREGFAVRIRRLLTDPDPYLPDFDGDRVAKEREYKKRSLPEAIRTFREARAGNLATLRAVPEAQWSRRGTQEGVGRVALCDVPQMMAEHDAAHRAEITEWIGGPVRPPMAERGRPFLWCVMLLLCVIGVAAAAGRSLFPADLTTRLDPFRTWLLASVGRTDPLARERPEELARFDGPFAAHPYLTLLHVVPGGLFLALAPLQFSARIRSRYIRLHRWSGRVLLLAGVASAAPAFYFGLVMPFGGPVEATAIAVFGALFVASLARAFVAIRRRRVELHREWMIRAFAVAIAISTIRVIGAVLDVALVTTGVPPRVGFVIALWAGWIVTVGAAELWIRRTRPGALAVTRTPAAPRSTEALRAP